MFKGRLFKGFYEHALASSLHTRANGQAEAHLHAAGAKTDGKGFWLKAAYGVGGLTSAAALGAVYVNDGGACSKL